MLDIDSHQKNQVQLPAKQTAQLKKQYDFSIDVSLDQCQETIVQGRLQSERLVGGALYSSKSDNSPKAHKISVANKQSTKHMHQYQLTQKPTDELSKQSNRSNNIVSAVKTTFQMKPKYKKANIFNILQTATKLKAPQKQKQNPKSQLYDLRQLGNHSNTFNIQHDTLEIISDKQRKQLIKQSQYKKIRQKQIQIISKKSQQIQADFKYHTTKGNQFRYTYDIDGEILYFQPKANSQKQNHMSHNYRINTQDSNTKDHTRKHSKQAQFTQSFSTKLRSTSKGSSISHLRKSNHTQIKNFIVYRPQGLIYKQKQKQAHSHQNNIKNTLYNNNGKRQTTSMPFFVASTGTRYRQLDAFNSPTNKHSVTQTKSTFGVTKSKILSSTKSYFQINNYLWRKDLNTLEKMASTESDIAHAITTTYRSKTEPNKNLQKTDQFQREINVKNNFKEGRISIKNQNLANTIIQ